MDARIWPRGRWLSLIVCLCLVAVSISVFIQIRHQFTLSFSYWLDEIFSVNLAHLSFVKMIDRVSWDVHPPLYYTLLWLWSQLFGLGEIGTRSLSALSAVGTILVLFALRPKISGTSFWLLLFFVLLNSKFHFYAMETRSYALLMFLSACVLVSEIRGRVWTTIGLCVLLGATHYFGTLIAFFTLGRLAVRNPQSNIRVGAAIAALIISIWPLVQLIFTNVRRMTGGNFWIDSQGVEVFSDAFSGTVPTLIRSISQALEASGFSLVWLPPFLTLLLLATVLLPALSRREGANTELQIACDAGLVVLVVTTTVFIVGFHTPLSTDRNFTSLIPQASLTLAIACSAFASVSRWRTVLMGGLLACYAGLSAYYVKEDILRKTAPLENWREMSATATQISLDRSIPVGRIEVGGWITNVYTWYLPEGVSVLSLKPDTDWSLLPASVVMLYDLHCRAREPLEAALAKTGRAVETITVTQSSSCVGGAPKNLIYIIGE